MVDRFEELRTYVAIVEAGGVNAAAARIGIARSAVSRRLSDLEARLGATLVERSTRRFELTDMGRAFLDDSKRVLNDLDAMEAKFAGGEAATSMTVAVERDALGLIATGLAGYSSANPSTRIRVIADPDEDVTADVVVASTDTTGGRKVGELSWIVVASPSYLSQNPPPITPADLSVHRGILIHGAPGQWSFRRKVQVQPNIVFEVPDAQAAIALASAGAGLAHVPRQLVETHLSNGIVVSVLDGHEGSASSVVGSATKATLNSASLIDYLAR